MSSATLLLPARSRFPAGALPIDVARALGRGETSQQTAGEHAQLRRHFEVSGADWPVAALTRQLDAGDAGDAAWLRADPVQLVPDMHGARMMAHGERLGLEPQEAAALVAELQPLFAAHGLQLDAPTPSRWYVRVPAEVMLPTFSAADDVLGDDVFAHLPDGPEGRLWRALLSESQVVLHAHAGNAARGSRGLPPVNSVWFWGGGVLPTAVSTRHAQVRSRDALLRGLGHAAGVALDGEQSVDALVDLRHLRSLEQLVAGALQPLLAALKAGELARLELDFEDGRVQVLTRAQRWQFWKKPLQLDG